VTRVRSPRFSVRPLLLALLGLSLLSPLTALAQEDELPDAGTQVPPPDAGDEEPEDTTGRIVEVCRTTSDCSPRFACDDGRCRYQGTRQAERVGCMLGPEGAVAMVGFGLVAGLRRRAGH
jgi:hypothetical protein